MRILSSALVVLMLTTSAVSAAPTKAPVKSEPAVVEVSPIYDPIEPFNRAVFQFNRFIDFLILKPVTKVYTTVTPDIAQTGVTNFLSNLGEPVNLLNNLLQGNWLGARKTFERAYINTVYGVLGFIDVAEEMGIHKQNADFGQTMGKWGVGHGMYLVLPVMGPSSARDGSGLLVDAFVDPYNQAFMDSETEWPIYARAGLTVIDARARYGDEIDRTMKNAVDPYVTFRSIYAQRRAYVVQDKSIDSYGDAEIE
jgi:phospholipid-binding lipoprotein MlaA